MDDIEKFHPTFAEREIWELLKSPLMAEDLAEDEKIVAEWSENEDVRRQAQVAFCQLLAEFPAETQK